MLWTAWRYGNAGPRGVYELYNGFGSWPPRHPDRLATLIMAFGLFADEREREIAGHKIQRRALGG